MTATVWTPTLAVEINGTEVGYATSARISVAMNDLVFGEVRLLGSLAYANDHPATIKMIADGLVDPFQFITGRIDLDDIVASGFDELINNKEENVKILVRPGS